MRQTHGVLNPLHGLQETHWNLTQWIIKIQRKTSHHPNPPPLLTGGGEQQSLLKSVLTHLFPFQGESIDSRERVIKTCGYQQITIPTGMGNGIQQLNLSLLINRCLDLLGMDSNTVTKICIKMPLFFFFLIPSCTYAKLPSRTQQLGAENTKERFQKLQISEKQGYTLIPYQCGPAVTLWV